jgi:putative ABC transport system permease protein
MAQGVSYEFDKVSDVPVGEGRYFTPQEAESGRNVILLDPTLPKTSLLVRAALGQELKLKGARFKIIGVMERQGENMLGIPGNDKNIIMPYGAFMRLYPTGPNGIAPAIAVKGQP